MGQNRNMTDYDLAVSARIRARRKEVGLSQYQLADAMNVSRSTVENWERGLTRVWIGVIAPLAQVLKTTPNLLLGWDESASAAPPQCPEYHPRYRSLRCSLEVGHDDTPHETGAMTWMGRE